ncbi:MAG: hypothetical protein EAZ85_09605 [Bacteroidetes bacterium]|nr:MAG: hypothetical protein EAZ85_09605 [Bacteroidota bacterium]TAG86402.1 MAG: hypothetical protein EAZ20_12850 [Bacteroidota bacterium]
MKKNLSLCLLFYSIISFVYAQKSAQNLTDKSVRFIYLVSKDRKFNPAYQKGIEMAAKDIQGWYKKQMNGFTFKLNNPIVEVAYSNKAASFFYSNPNGENKDQWGYNNTFAECQRLLKIKYNDPNYIWVIYSDGPGNQGMGGGGVCIMPEDDLLGLIGKHKEQPEINRWIAGLGHEGGHAFGLPHPKDTKKDADAIMWTGIYGKYPDKCYLTEEDKAILRKSPFFFDDKGVNIAGESKKIAEYTYSAGKFVKMKNTKTNEITWIETNSQNDVFYFSETSQDKNFYYLKATNRPIDISIPINNGKGFISTDGGKKWSFFQNFNKL